MAANLLNRARMTTATTGTGTVTLGSAVTKYLTFAEAGAVNATKYAYCIEDGNDFEFGEGTYTSSGTTFSRDTVTVSKISGTAGTSKINLSGSAEIFITPRQSDLLSMAGSQTFTAAEAAQGRKNISTASFSANKNATNQTGISSNTDTKVTFTTESFDSGSYYDAANSKWTPPAGKVMIFAQLYVTGTFTATNGPEVCAVWKNGAILKEGFFYSGTANQGMANCTVIDDANGTDYYEIYVRQNTSSGTVTVDGTAKWSFFMGTLI